MSITRALLAFFCVIIIIFVGGAGSVREGCAEAVVEGAVCGCGCGGEGGRVCSGGGRCVPRVSSSKVSVPYMRVPGAGQRDL